MGPYKCKPSVIINIGTIKTFIAKWPAVSAEYRSQNLTPFPGIKVTSPFEWKILKRVVKQLTSKQSFLNKVYVSFKNIVQ